MRFFFIPKTNAGSSVHLFGTAAALRSVRNAIKGLPSTVIDNLTGARVAATLQLWCLFTHSDLWRFKVTRAILAAEVENESLGGKATRCSRYRGRTHHPARSICFHNHQYRWDHFDHTAIQFGVCLDSTLGIPECVTGVRSSAGDGPKATKEWRQGSE